MTRVVYYFSHSRVELFDGHAACFRHHRDALDWLATMVPGGEIDHGGRIFDSMGLHVGDVLDVIDEGAHREAP